MELRNAKGDDVGKIITLLRECNLPTEDILPEKIFFKLIADRVSNVIACAGFESYHDQGLFRSFAVHPSRQKMGLGKVILGALELEARQVGIKQFHLLTNTAESYFLSKGFLISQRTEAPLSIQLTSEFTSMCPASAVYMTKMI